MPRRPVALAVATLTLLGACGTDSTSTGTTPPPTDAVETTTSASATTTATDATTNTTLDSTKAALAYTEYGPFPVGVTTLQLDDATPVEVWYPAVAGSAGVEVFDMRIFIPASIDALLVDDAPTTLSYSAARDADVAEGTFPVVLFSHGTAGVRLQSTTITSNLASWGMIVVAPQHPSRDLNAALSGGGDSPRVDSVADLLDALELITAEGQDTSSPFSGRIDSARIGAVGHSAGGGTVLRAADDPRIDGYVSMASGALRGRSGDTDATTTTVELSMPDTPSFFIAGSADAIVPADSVTEQAFLAAPSPSTLWVIEGAGHTAFTDFCRLGDGLGIIGVAESSGLSELLGSFPQLRALGEDGCLPPAIYVATTFPIINHAVTAWLLHLFGVDDEPVGLGPEVADSYDTPVVIRVK